MECLFQNVIQKRCQRNKDASTRKPQSSGGADIRVACFHLVGLHHDNVVLLQIIVRGADKVCIVEVQRVDFLTTRSILANELHTIAYTVDGKVSGLGKCLENVDLLT